MTKADLVEAVYQTVGFTKTRAAEVVNLILDTMKEALEIPVRVPPAELCTDNAAMIAAAAHWHFINGRRDSLNMDVIPSLQLV